MELRVERFKFVVEDGLIILIMAIFKVLKELLNTVGPIDWPKFFIKIFTNFIAGMGFYSFLLAYKEWYGQYPQKVGVIMVVVYAGSNLIDVVVEAIYKFDFKEMIKRWMQL